MINHQTAQYFKIQELVPESIYKLRGKKAWQLIDERLIANLDCIKEQLETIYNRKIPITVNDWLWGGNRVASGLRVPGQKEYSETSQHKLGKAVDFKCEIPAHDIRNLIRHGSIILPYPACFEEFNGMSWVHMDVRNFVNGQVYFFKIK